MTENEPRSLASWVGLWIAALLIALMLAALPGCGGGGGGQDVGDGDGSTPPPPVADGALKAAQPGELVSYFKSRLHQQANQPVAPAPIDFSAAPPASPATGSAAVIAGAPQQEAGVDEDDLLKTDGTMLYALHPSYRSGTETVPSRLASQRREADGSLAARSTSTLNQEFQPVGLYLAGAASRIAVLGQKSSYDVFLPAATASSLLFPGVPPERKLSVDVFSTADNGRPSQTSRMEIDGTLVGSRMIGSVLYLVSNWTPDVSRYSLPEKPTREQADAALAALTTAELLPRIKVDGAAPVPLVTEQECLIQPANASPVAQLTTITAIDLSTSALTRKSLCFVGGVESLYMSAANVYLASSRQYWTTSSTASTVFPATSRTDIHKFALQGLQVSYRASGEVAGHLGWDQEKKPYRMSEFNGDLRILTFTGDTGWSGPAIFAPPPQQKASPATLTILREDTAGRSLKAVATLPNSRRPADLGHQGEQVYAVHFTGATAYVVTFRRTDPLYVLDLSDPADPRAAGELQMPGYSDYLFPLADGKLLGVGKDANEQGIVGGVKIALFDVADPTRPRVVTSRVLGGSGSQSALDYSRHGISLGSDGSKVHVALPVRLTAGTRSSEQGLARYLVDTVAGTMDELPFTLAARIDFADPDVLRYDLGAERSVRIQSDTYYLSGGSVTRVP